MGNRRRWSEFEDRAIERATADNAELGIVEFRPHGRRHERGDYAGRLRHVAEQLGRSYAAVLKRAQRIGATSYRSRERENAR